MSFRAFRVFRGKYPYLGLFVLTWTVSRNDVVARRPPPSVTVSVIVAVPLWPAIGVTVTVRDAPAPPNTIFAVGASVVLLDAPVTVNDAAGVKSSAKVMANAGVTVFIMMVWFAKDEIVGGALIVRVKFDDADKASPLVTVSVMVVTPLCPATGIT